MLEILDPRGVTVGEAAARGTSVLPSAPRTLTILDNSKANADTLFGTVLEGLREARPSMVVTRARKGSAGNPCPPELFDEIAASADLVLTGTAD